MIEYPKYTICLSRNHPLLPYVLFEHMSGVDRHGTEDLMSKVVGMYETYHEALVMLSSLSDQPLILATCSQLIDNVVKI
jgi:hypothetical protein